MSTQRTKITRALIIGATSSLAVTLARSLAKQGADIVLAGRDEEALKRLRLDLAVRSQSAIEIRLLDLANDSLDCDEFMEGCGEIDAAFMLVGAMGENNTQTIDNIEHVTSVNYTRLAALLSAAAQRMEEGSGVIAVVSSVAGDRGRAANFVYGSAKSALTTYASGLRAKLVQEGSKVHVLTVKPGFIDTPMTYAMNSGLTASREKVAADILRGVERRRNILYTPSKWWLIMLIITHLPERIFKKLKL